MATIHSTALVDPAAKLADDVEIGPYCLVEADVALGPGTVLRPHAIVRRYTTLGSGNFVDSFAVLGGLPQDLKFKPDTVSFVRIGDNNVFREGVTVSRATGEGHATTVGSGTYWMTGSHAGHDATVHDDAGQFVPHRDRRDDMVRGPRIPLIDMQVGPTDRGRPHLNEDFVRFETRDRHVDHGEAWTGDELSECAHGAQAITNNCCPWRHVWGRLRVSC